VRVRNLLGVVGVSLLLFNGCTTVNKVENKSKVIKPSTSSNWQNKASIKVQELLKKGNFEVVDTNYVKSKLGKGVRVSSKAIIIDTRPAKKYMGGHVPTAYLIPDTAFDKYYPVIENMDKSKEIITYCGGWKCAKSPKVALLLKAKGWKNVKVYQEGMPAWNKNGNYKEVDLRVVKSAVKKGNALIIDTRPVKMFKRGHIPTSINIPDTHFEDYTNLLPSNKNSKIITYCGGYKCAKSHNVAKKLVKLGYKKVMVYAAGEPEWRKKGLEIEKSTKQAVKKTENSDYVVVNGVKLVADQEENAGMVYGEFFKDVVAGKVKDVVLVSVIDKESFDAGHIKNSINIPFEDMPAKDFVNALNKITKSGKKVILVCTSGARATDAMGLVQDNGGDTKSIFFADANIDCEGTKCTVSVNEPL